MIFCLTVDDVCLEGYSTVEHTNALMRFFASQGIHGTFFVVPRAEGIPLTERSEYTVVLEEATAEGHEVAQHGLEHDRFETGIPPRMILDLPHEQPARERLAKDRASIDKNLELPALRGRMAEGRRILEDALGIGVAGFRAPCLSVCDNLFTALDQEGFRYDSSRSLQENGWDLLQGKPLAPQPITRASFESSLYPGKMRTLPLTTEYTWYLQRKQFDDTMALARHDFSACLRAGIPFTTVAHVSPINECQDGCGWDLYRRLIDYAREQSAAVGDELQLLTLSETCERFFA